MGKNATELRAVIFSSPSTDVAKQEVKAVPAGILERDLEAIEQRGSETEIIIHL